ncbi:MAG: WD40 repeat domain-containing protein, partial [Planctomycetes bacterium]|nr:WD40 repeat domain-containing protein [Planctomycetota bacterium]
MLRTKPSVIRWFNAIIVGCLMSHTGYAADAARIAIAMPSVEAGEIDALAFADRLVTAFASDDRLDVHVLERATDEESARKLAQSEGYDFLLTTSIRSKKITGLSAITDVLGVTKKGGEERWRVEVSFELRRVDGGAIALEKTSEKSEGPAEQTVVEVATKVAGLVAATIHEPVPARSATIAETATTPSVDSRYSAGDDTAPPRLVVQTSHAAAVVDFVYSPDGVVLATLGADGVVKIWNTSSGKEIDTYAGYPITGVAFHPSRNWLAGIGSDDVVRIFDIPSGELIRQLTPLKGRKKGESSMGGMFGERVPIAFAASEDLLVHGGKTGATVWSVASGARVRTFKARGGTSVLALSPDGSKVVTVIKDNELRVYSVATGKNIKKIDAMVIEVSALAFAPDSRTLMVGSRNGSVRLFDVDRGRQVGDPPLLDKCDAAKVISKTVGLIGGLLGGSVLGDLADLGRQVVDVCETISAIGIFADQGMMGYMTRSVRSLAMTPDGDLLAYSLGDNTVRVIDMRDRAPLYEITPSLKVKFAESDEIPSGDQDEPGESIAAWGFLFQAPVKFSRNGNTLDMVGNFKTVARWDARSGVRLSSLAVSQRDSSFGMPFPLPRASVAVFGQDGRTLLTATLTGGTRLWDLDRGLPPEQVSQASAMFNNPPVNSQGTLVVTTEKGDEGPRMVVREIGSGLEVQQFDLPNVDSGQNMFFEAPATFSPDSHSLAIQTFENEGLYLRVYDLESGKKLFEQRGVLHVEFGADGRYLAMLGDMGRRKSGGRQNLRVVETAKWKTVFDKRIVATDTFWMTAGFALSAASDYIAAIDGTNIRVRKIDGATSYRQRNMPVGGVSHMVFNPVDDSLTFTGQRALMHWDIHADTLRTSTLQTDFWGNLSYSADGKLLALGGA